jgi:transposase-like protein
MKNYAGALGLDETVVQAPGQEGQRTDDMSKPTKYRKEFAKQAHKACAESGAAETSLAAMFGVETFTINQWKQDHPEFLEAVEKGMREANQGVVKALCKRAVGFEHDGKRYPPDPAARAFLQKNGL